MSYAVRETVSLTTDASGDAIGYTANVTGRIHSIKYTKDDFADTVDFTITTEATAQNAWVQENVTATATVAPRQATHSTAGVASLYAAAGEPVETPVVAVNERIKIVVANGGDAKSGTFDVIVV
jgi:hypothetical protein